MVALLVTLNMHQDTQQLNNLILLVYMKVTNHLLLSQKMVQVEKVLMKKEEILVFLNKVEIKLLETLF